MSSQQKISAVLFDIDGTLVDSNYLHTDAWKRAFDDLELSVDTWRIHRAIGMDSAKLLASLLGDRADEYGDHAKDLHSEHYEKLTDRLVLLDGAVELLHGVKERGLQVVLATSAPEDELKVLLEVLDSDDVIDEVTSSKDVGTAKPEPDLIGVALERAGIAADQAVMVGDAVYDSQAASRAGVASIGLLTGGYGEAELIEAGASLVFADARALLESLDDALARAVPTKP